METCKCKFYASKTCVPGVQSVLRPAWLPQEPVSEDLHTTPQTLAVLTRSTHTETGIGRPVTADIETQSLCHISQSWNPQDFRCRGPLRKQPTRTALHWHQQDGTHGDCTPREEATRRTTHRDQLHSGKGVKRHSGPPSVELENRKFALRPSTYAVYIGEGQSSLLF